MHPLFSLTFRILVIPLAISIFISGCGSFSSNVAKLSSGMSRKEVIEIAGSPEDVVKNRAEEALDYKDGIIILRNGKYSYSFLKKDLYFEVNIDALSSRENVGKKAIIFSGDKDISVSDIQFKEFAGFVKELLKNKGYSITNDEKKAETAIFLSYGISEPKIVTRNYTVPVYGMISSGKTKTTSSQTKASASAYGSGTGSYGSYNPYVGSSYGGYNYSARGSAYGIENTEATESTSPEYGVIGTETRQVTITTFTCYLALDAMDLKLYKKQKELKQHWKTVITSTGPSGDLRRVFPVLVTASFDNIDVSTGNILKWVVTEKDPRLSMIMGRIPASTENK